jgi:indole-3-glycerol phosphate synthase
VLLECFDAGDLERTTSFMSAADADKAAAGQLLFGVNTRNLRTLEVDPDRLADLASLLPPGRSVAESGLKTADDAARVAAMGYSMALVGTALMRQRNPMELLTDMRAAGEAGLAS